MDTVYGTKKYFQSLSGVGSDIYRSSTCRAVTNDYSSYQNTLGRRSALTSYTHMTKHPSYLTDFSLGSHYGYNTWGMWRDTRNLSPSTYSSKSRQSVKSFSIILTTAAFIVVLAVLSIAGLAFYFSTFKTNAEDSVMVFQGSFRVSKGDIFTTGLKYNHTSTFKQKVDFYKRFLERSLTDNGLQPAKIDVFNFGDGPLLNVLFRTYLDMRNLPRNIHSVEEHIKESIFLETTSMKSLYKSLKIDPETIVIKRIMDEEFVKSASFARDVAPSQSQTHFEKRLNKKTGTVEKSAPKIPTTQKSKTKLSDDEPDIDVENAPVIQGSFEGSFEITKTDADITRKRTTPTKSVTTSITPFPTKLKVKKPTIEKITPPSLKTTESTTATATSTTTSTTTTSTTTTTTTTTESTPLSSSTAELSSSSIITLANDNFNMHSSSTASSALPLEESFGKISNFQNPPKLDTNLFTNPPVMDTEPWRPIRPDGMHPANNLKPTFGISPTSFDAIESGLVPRNKFKITDQITKNPNEMIFYHSFTNPVFMPGTSGIEKLGSTDVKPHPLPVPLIDEAMIPPFKPLYPTIHTETYQPINISSELGEKFEHIGGGVIVKKHEETTPTVINTTVAITPSSTLKVTENPTEQTSQNITHFSTTERTIQKVTSESTNNISEVPSLSVPGNISQYNKKEENDNDGGLSLEVTDKLADFLLDLLEVSKEENETQEVIMESRVEPEENEKPNFLNIKEVILNRNKMNNTKIDGQLSGLTKTTPTPNISSTTKLLTTSSAALEKFSTTVKPVTIRRKTTGKPKPKPTQPNSVDSARTTPLTLDDSLLFPSHSKWEYVNGSSNGFTSTTPMKKVFNETLQAWVVENDERSENHTIRDLAIKRNNTEELQNISLIFDTLVSKLGISPNIPTKIPPFAAFAQNKLKQSHRNDTRNKTKSTTTTTTTTTTRPNYFKTSTPITTFEFHNLTSSTTVVDSHEIVNMSPETIVGEAEVEVVDPTKYEEMLSSSSKSVSSTSTSHPPTLVTLLPVRSNSGIRTFRPLMKSGTSAAGSESRRFVYHPKYREAVVKTGIQVTV